MNGFNVVTYKVLDIIMALPPSEKLRARMLLVVMVVLVVELPGAQQKCIFDEVQSQVRVVRAADSPPSEPRLGTLTRQESQLISSRQTSRPRRSVKQRSSLDELAPAPPQPIRIQTWMTRDRNNPSEMEKGRLEAAVEEAVRTVSSLLSVNRGLGPLLLRRDVNKYCKFLWKNSSTVNYNRCGRATSNYRAETCLDVTIPDDHLAGCDIYPEANSPRRIVLRPEGAGVPDADFLLYLHVQATDKCRAEPNVSAYAVHCQTDTHGRPMAGVVVICRDGMTGSVYSHQTTVQTLIHEMFHALGFSKDLFSTWQDCSSSSQDGVRCSPRGKVTHSDGSGQVRIYTPSIISALQEHLASTDPELGGPLENLDVSPGRVSSHWESRVLQGSIMASVLGESTAVRIDPVTLAALQDTGWYTVNLSRAQSLVWGNGEGAAFGSLSTCQDNSSSFFCSGSGPGCHFLHLHKGGCQTDPYLEGCRVYKTLKNGSECWKSENARLSAEDDWGGEIFGIESRCFFSSLIRQDQILGLNSSVQGQCYRHRCTGANSFQIQVLGSGWVDCPAGLSVQVKGYQGLVFCPHKRLCLYADVKPPLDDAKPFSACITCDPETLTSTQNHSWSLLRPGLIVCFTAAVCLVAALIVSYRKCRCWTIRIHSVAPEDRSNP